MKGFMTRDGGGVRRKRFLADREPDASRPERERFAAGAGPRRDRHLDALPGPPGSAYPDRIPQQPRGICQRFYDGLRDGGREPPLPGMSRTEGRSSSQMTKNPPQRNAG